MTEHQSKPPETTVQEDLTTAGQRRINMIWETTQAIIAGIVIVTNMVVSVIFVIKRIPAGEYPLVLSSSLFLIVGFYFSRTNHAAIGGMGSKPTQPKYEGR